MSAIESYVGKPTGSVLDCSECGARSSVVDSRASRDHVCRRHECPNCKGRWTTYEISQEMFLAIRATKTTRRHLEAAQTALNTAVDALSDWSEETMKPRRHPGTLRADLTAL